MNKRRIIFLVILLQQTLGAFSFDNLFERDIELTNECNVPVWVASYSRKENEIKRILDPVCIEQRSTVSISRPTVSWTKSKHLVVAPELATLEPTLDRQTFNRLARRKIGVFGTSALHIIKDNPSAFRILEASTFQNLQKETALRTRLRGKGKNPSKSVVVATGDRIWEFERSYVSVRTPGICQALSTYLETPVNTQTMPRVALCCSGGGFRAMLATAGLIHGAKQAGWYDGLTHVATLSGSTWALGTMLAHQFTSGQLTNHLANSVEDGLLNPNKYIYRALKHDKQIANAYSRTLGPVNLYASFLGQAFFDGVVQRNEEETDAIPSWHEIKLSDLSQTSNPLTTPYTFFTSVTPSPDGYKWVEFSPYEVKSEDLDCSIPTWAFGRPFDKCISENFAPEPPFSYLLGMCGSSFTVTLNRVIKESLQFATSLFGKKEMTSLLKSGWADKHIMAAYLPNFSYNHPASPTCEQKEMCFVDGGYQCNIPLEPLLSKKRACDVIIILDCKQQKRKYATVLAKSIENARKKDLAVPTIDVEVARTQPISVFINEHDASCPILIYLPLRADALYDPLFDPAVARYCSTFNFTYRKHHSAKLMGLTEFLVKRYDDIIKETLRYVVARKASKDNASQRVLYNKLCLG